jgi:hypothetical protein
VAAQGAAAVARFPLASLAISASPLDWRNTVFIIRLFNGEEVHASEGDELEINPQTGVLSVSRVAVSKKSRRITHPRHGCR